MLIALSVSLCAQTPTPRFEAASIKRSAPDAHGGRTLTSGGRFEVSFWTVMGLIEWAYDVKPFQVIGGPAWLQTPVTHDTERFDVAAKTDAAVSTSQMRLMLQTLLAERFALKLGRETRELPVFTLITGKSGPNFQETTGGDPSLLMYRGGLVGHGATMSQLAAMLVRDRPVLDKTGLTGHYDFTLKWPDDDPNSPEIFTAIQEQLGLKLEASKGPVEVLVIDSCSKQPSEN